MCLAIPGKIESISGDDPLTRMGKINFGGILKEASLAYVPEAKVGDYVIVHVGFALSRVDEDEAHKVFEYLKQMEELGELEGGRAVKSAGHEIPRRIPRRRTARNNSRAEIHRVTTRPWNIMEVCGGQTHAIVKFGIDELLPKQITLIHGPGCPVCVTPLEMIDKALEIAARPDVIFTSFGDMLRVPGSTTDLLSVKAKGGDVRIVYSPLDAVKLAEQNPAKEVVFFGVGFETTAPATAMAVYQAAQKGLKNFSMLISHVLVPPAMEALLSSPNCRVQGFLAAGHVCTVMGYEEYLPLAAKYHVPIVVTGFEPLDILQGVLMVRAATGIRPGRSGKPIRARGAPRRQPAGAGIDPQGFPGRPAQMARHRRNPAKRPGLERGLRRVRRREEIRRGRTSRRRTGRMPQRPGVAGTESSRTNARPSARAARRNIRSARRWFRAKAPARPIIGTGDAIESIVTKHSTFNVQRSNIEQRLVNRNREC